MSSAPAVIVKRGGFFSTVAQGVFGSLMVLLICGTVLGLYGMHLWDQRAGTIVRELATALPEWRTVLPPVLVDALNDRSAIEYRQSLSINVRLATLEDEDEPVVVVEIANKGDEKVSLLALRVVLENARQTPVRELTVMAATPLVLKGPEWRGPIQRGETRVIAEPVTGVRGEVRPVLEVVELRVASPAVQNGPALAPPAGDPVQLGPSPAPRDAAPAGAMPPTSPGDRHPLPLVQPR